MSSIIKVLEVAKVARLLESAKFMMSIKSNITQRIRNVLYTTTIEVQILVQYFYYQVFKNHNVFMF
jgi:hypothetical protein